MKITLNYNNKTYYGTIPAKWEDLTVKQFIGLESNKNILEVFALLTGIELEAVENTEQDLEPYIKELTARFNEPPPNLKKLPRKEVEILGKIIKFPKTIEFTKFGQKSLTRTLVQNNDKLQNIIPEVFAIYAQPIIDGKFDTNRFDKITKEINRLPIVKVYPHVVFFFQKLNVLKNNLPNS